MVVGRCGTRTGHRLSSKVQTPTAPAKAEFRDAGDCPGKRKASFHLCISKQRSPVKRISHAVSECSALAPGRKGQCCRYEGEFACVCVPKRRQSCWSNVLNVVSVGKRHRSFPTVVLKCCVLRCAARAPWILAAYGKYRAGRNSGKCSFSSR